MLERQVKVKGRVLRCWTWLLSGGCSSVSGAWLSMVLSDWGSAVVTAGTLLLLLAPECGLDKARDPATVWGISDMNSRVHGRCYITPSSLGNLCKDGSGRLRVTAEWKCIIIVSRCITCSDGWTVPCMTKQSCVSCVSRRYFHVRADLRRCFVLYKPID